MSSMFGDLIYGRSADDAHRLLIPAAVIAQLKSFRQGSPVATEAGGLLLGVRRGPHIEITAATTPLPQDQRSRVSFLRCDPGHFKEAQRQWRESEHTVGYIGEWHSHPEPVPSPSIIDAAEWGKIVQQEQKQMIFLIVGTREWYVCRSIGQLLHWKWGFRREELRLL